MRPKGAIGVRSGSLPQANKKDIQAFPLGALFLSCAKGSRFGLSASRRAAGPLLFSPAAPVGRPWGASLACRLGRPLGNVPPGRSSPHTPQLLKKLAKLFPASGALSYIRTAAPTRPKGPLPGRTGQRGTPPAPLCGSRSQTPAAPGQTAARPYSPGPRRRRSSRCSGSCTG